MTKKLLTIKETAKILATNNEKILLGEFNSQGILKRRKAGINSKYPICQVWVNEW